MMEIQIRRGTSSYLTSQNPVLAAGEPCLEVDTGKVKYGDGVTSWNLLDYSSGEDVSFGTNNEATGTDAFAAGGSDNLASGARSAAVGGHGNTASGTSSAVLGGEGNEASAANSVVVGGLENNASGLNSVVLGGTGNVAEGENSVAMGRQAKADKESQVAISSGMFAAPGDAQTCVYNLRASTQGSTPTRMHINGSSGDLTLKPGSLWSFDVKVTAYDSTANLSGAWSIKGGIVRDFLGDTQFTAEPTTKAWADGWDEGTGPVVSADGATDSLAITVAGGSGRSVRWAAAVNTTEVISEEPLTSDMFVEVPADSQINSLEVRVGSGADMLQPAFNTAITDYVIYSSRGFYSSAEDLYSVSINGASPIQVSASVNKAIRVKHGIQDYFVRVLPSDFPAVCEVQNKAQDYIPGYYLMAFYGTAPYYGVFDENGIPVWYTHVDYDNSGCSDEPSPISLHAGWEPNRILTNNWVNNCYRWDIKMGLNSLTAKPYTMVNPDGRGQNHVLDNHESLGIRAPESRKSNFIYHSYTNTGFYIQEQNQQGQIVWEWWSDDYFNTTYTEQFHTNSLDVHPVTGDILVSARHMGAVFAIDYETKDIIWILQGDGHCHASGPMTNYVKPSIYGDIHWIVPYDEPTVQGYSQYNGPDAQHDARWQTEIDPVTPGNALISISDNQSCNNRAARGVVYEIDLANDRAVFRTQAYSPYGSTVCCGNFAITKEANGLFSGTFYLSDQDPDLIEVLGDSSGNFDQNNVVLEMKTAHNPGAGAYRIIKVTPDFLNINYMRTTAGRIPTIV